MGRPTKRQKEARRRFEAVWSARQRRIDRYNAREAAATEGHASLYGRQRPNVNDYFAATERMAAEREIAFAPLW